MRVKVCLRPHVLIVNYQHYYYYYYYWFQCMVRESICVCILQHCHASLQAMPVLPRQHVQQCNAVQCSAVYVTSQCSFRCKLHCTELASVLPEENRLCYVARRGAWQCCDNNLAITDQPTAPDACSYTTLLKVWRRTGLCCLPFFDLRYTSTNSYC